MATKKATKRAGAKKASRSGGAKKTSKKSTRVSAKGILAQAKKAVGKVVVAAAKGAAAGALQGAVEEGSKVKGTTPAQGATKKTKGAAKKTSRKK